MGSEEAKEKDDAQKSVPLMSKMANKVMLVVTEAYLSLVVLTERKAWTISALIELRGLSLIKTKICSSFSRLMKFPNQDLLASLQTDKYFADVSVWSELSLCSIYVKQPAHRTEKPRSSNFMLDLT